MQKIIDSTLEAAQRAGCDTVQLKYDGMPVQFAIARGKMNITDFNLKLLVDPLAGFDETINCTLLGSFLPHNFKCYIFDCWCVEENDITIDLRAEPYRSRYVAAKIQCKLLGSFVTLVANAPISQSIPLWRSLVNVDSAKGLVFRDSRADAKGPVRVARWYKEAPRELI